MSLGFSRSFRFGLYGLAVFILAAAMYSLAKPSMAGSVPAVSEIDHVRGGDAAAPVADLDALVQHEGAGPRVGDVALLVEHHGFERVGLDRLDLGLRPREVDPPTLSARRVDRECRPRRPDRSGCRGRDTPGIS